MLDIENASVSYGEAIAVSDVSLRVEEGEWVSLIGPNGAGKTSTIKAILGLVKSSGKFTFLGEDIGHLKPWDRQQLGFGYVPEGRHLFGDMTIEQNLRIGAYHASKEDVETELERMFTLFPRVKERRRQLARTLSGGEQQMVALGRALMGRPRLLLVDEASLGLMPINVDIVFEALSRLHKEGQSILLVEQNARKALRYTQRAYVMEAGELVLSDTSKAVASNPQVIESYIG